jgi:hypothetical protein
MQDMLFDLIRHIHHMCETSSADELQASTLGKDKGEGKFELEGQGAFGIMQLMMLTNGHMQAHDALQHGMIGQQGPLMRSIPAPKQQIVAHPVTMLLSVPVTHSDATEGKEVKMLMHHSRNTEQKRWEESLMLALGGAAKVLRAHLPTVVHMEGFSEAWAGLMQVRTGVYPGQCSGCHAAESAMWLTPVRVLVLVVLCCSTAQPNCMPPCKSSVSFLPLPAPAQLNFAVVAHPSAFSLTHHTPPALPASPSCPHRC